MTSNQDRWIPVEEAFRLQARRLGLPPARYLETLEKLAPLHAGLMWLSDQPITLHELPTGLAFDRSEFEAVLAKIGSAGHRDDA